VALSAAKGRVRGARLATNKFKVQRANFKTVLNFELRTSNFQLSARPLIRASLTFSPHAGRRTTWPGRRPREGPRLADKQVQGSKFKGRTSKPVLNFELRTSNFQLRLETPSSALRAPSSRTWGEGHGAFIVPRTSPSSFPRTPPSPRPHPRTGTPASAAASRARFATARRSARSRAASV